MKQLIMPFLEKLKALKIWHYRFELGLLIVVTVAVFSLMGLTSQVSYSENPITGQNQTQVLQTGYRLMVDQEIVGYIESAAIGEAALSQALTNVRNTLGYNPELAPEIRFYEMTNLEEPLISQEALIETLESNLIASIDVIRQQGFVMKIGEHFRVAVGSLEEAEAVLQAAQDTFVSGEKYFSVSLIAKEHNSLVLTPVITEVLAEALTDRQFVTAGEGDEGDLDVEPLTEADVVVEADAVFDPYFEGQTKEVAFGQSVIVAPTFIDPEDLISVEEAVALITKEHEKPQTYTVARGDSASTIAQKHSMALSALYGLNEGLENNEKRLQVGQELVVMVPEPELSVTTYEEVVYAQSIPRGTVYQETSSKYAGHTATIDHGYDGSMEVTAILTKVNGKITERIITGEQVITEAKSRVIEKGTKPLPSKGASGSFAAPLASVSVSSRFGRRSGGYHYGVDLTGSTGTTIRATDGGVVTYAKWMGSYGNLIIIDHGGGVTSRYAHASRISVKVGQYVAQYEKIGEVGSTGRSTGPHLHFEIRFDGVASDPMKYISY